MDQYKLKEYMAAEPEAKLRDQVSKLLYDEIIALRIAPGSRLNVNQIAASLSFTSLSGNSADPFSAVRGK